MQLFAICDHMVILGVWLGSALGLAWLSLGWLWAGLGLAWSWLGLALDCFGLVYDFNLALPEHDLDQFGP